MDYLEITLFPFSVCCPPLSTGNPPRVPAPPGTPGDELDECAVLRRIQRGMCPTYADIVCSAARGMQVDQVILQFLNGNTVVAAATGTTRATGVITCTIDGYKVTNAAGQLVPFTSVSCTQNTIEVRWLIRIGFNISFALFRVQILLIIMLMVLALVQVPTKISMVKFRMISSKDNKEYKKWLNNNNI